jgi:hypothetical protein
VNQWTPLGEPVDDEIESLVVAMRRNYWICEWSLSSSGILARLMRSKGQDGVVYKIQRRNKRLGKGTRKAAKELLCAARPILFARRTTSDDVQVPSTSSAASSYPACNPSALPLPPIDPPNPASSPSSPSNPATIIQSLPYEVLDHILRFLSPGKLSSRQHNAIMRFAEDRRTLSEEIAFDDFQHGTDSRRWESEDGNVNRGFANESYEECVASWIRLKEKKKEKVERGGNDEREMDSLDGEQYSEKED